MKQPGIHFRILVTAFILISSVSFILGITGINITREYITRRFTDNIFFMARHLATNAEAGIMVGDRAWLKRLAANLLTEKNDIVKISIADSSGNLLVDITKNYKGPDAFVELPVIPRKPVDANSLFSSSALNVLSGKLAEQPVGKISIRFTTRNIDNLLQRITQRFFWLSLALASCACVIFFFISRSIVSEVSMLSDTAKKVARGNFDLRAEPGRLPETGRLATAFNAMLDTIEKSRKALKATNKKIIRQSSMAEMGKFSMMIAHEVKNPLAIIKGSIDVLKKKHDPATNSLMIEYIEDEVMRLNRLIEHFLVFARPARPVFREVDVNGLLVDIVSRFKIQDNNAEFFIKENIPQTECKIMADPDLLSRALGNIIRNAIDAGKNKDGPVNISARTIHDFWIAEVADHGDGIPEEEINRIFEPFFTTKAKGSGLGLAFASQAIKAHGGIIAVKNIPEGGALFSVELKIEEE
ncbi:hypothetical protein BuS5_03692 [Desulfosarcina sp. BuS5]|uniref:sensor histidine kinase n=1 Tax=Desulfosarcina sp. BuS5 TaxID=933262 RepID=UPI00055738F2|nr:ATP-binding protein [Desulfosarcina sp. BuS5]WDN90721.1 hypothetical protein BuS5_03692 [Desulfosarcina sp. BuS5]